MGLFPKVTFSTVYIYINWHCKCIIYRDSFDLRVKRLQNMHNMCMNILLLCVQKDRQAVEVHKYSARGGKG